MVCSPLQACCSERFGAGQLHYCACTWEGSFLPDTSTPHQIHLPHVLAGCASAAAVTVGHQLGAAWSLCVPTDPENWYEIYCVSPRIAAVYLLQLMYV